MSFREILPDQELHGRALQLGLGGTALDEGKRIFNGYYYVRNCYELMHRYTLRDEGIGTSKPQRTDWYG